MDDRYNPMSLTFKNNIPEMDDQYNPILDGCYATLYSSNPILNYYAIQYPSKNG